MIRYVPSCTIAGSYSSSNISFLSWLLYSAVGFLRHGGAPSFMKSNSSLLSLPTMLEGSDSMYGKVSSTFYSCSLKRLGLTFRYLIHFDLSFVCSERCKGVLVSFSCPWMSTFPTHWQDFHVTLCVLSANRKSPLSVDAWVYFYGLYFITWVYVSLCLYLSKHILVIDL